MSALRNKDQEAQARVYARIYSPEELQEKVTFWRGSCEYWRNSMRRKAYGTEWSHNDFLREYNRSRRTLQKYLRAIEIQREMEQEEVA